jgi:general secretion pathway protein C
MLARLAAFLVWALVAATAVFWGLRLTVRAPRAPAFTVPVAESAALRGDLGRLLGATPAAGGGAPVAVPELASRFKLLGLMAGREPTDPGLALIAVDSKPARPFAVGATIEEGLVLQSVSLRKASIGPAQGGPALTLEIPPLPAPATGTLPSTLGAQAAGQAAPLRPVPPPMSRPAAAATAVPPGRPPVPGQRLTPGATTR